MIIETKFKNLRANSMFSIGHAHGECFINEVKGHPKLAGKGSTRCKSVTYDYESKTVCIYAFSDDDIVFTDESRVRKWYHRLFGLKK